MQLTDRPAIGIGFPIDVEPIEEMCQWETSDDKAFYPNIRNKVKKHLPSGVYRIVYDQQSGGMMCALQPEYTDELYSLSNSVTSKLLAATEEFWEKADLYKENGFKHKRGILLEGPAGTSKTSTINLLVQQLKKKDGLIFLINSAQDLAFTSTNLKEIVRRIEPERPIITIIEDVDKLLEERGAESLLLDMLDGSCSIDHNIIIMTSNDTSELSSALLRPSRVDLRIVLTSPPAEVRREFLEKKKMPEDLISQIVPLTEGMSFAQLKEIFICTVILGYTIEESVQKVSTNIEGRNYLDITTNNKFGI